MINGVPEAGHEVHEGLPCFICPARIVPGSFVRQEAPVRKVRTSHKFTSDIGGGAPLVQVRRTPHPPAAAGTPVSLRDTITGLDDRNTTLLITAIQHAAGNYSLADDRSRLR